MKRWCLKWMIVAMTILTGTATAGYRQLDDRLKAYEPPPARTFRNLEEAAPERPDQLNTEVDRLLKRSDEWLNKGFRGGHFLKMDRTRTDALKTIAAHDSSLLKFLEKPAAIHDLEILTLFRNESVKAAEDRFRAVLRQFSQTAYLDEIIYQYSAFTQSVMTGVGPMKGKDAIAKKFPFPGMMALKGDIVTHNAAMALENLAIERRNAVTQMRKAYWNLLYVRQAETITRETLNLFADLEDVAATQYRSGKMNFQDVTKVKIRKRTLEEELITLNESRRNLETIVLNLLHLNPGVTAVQLIESRPSASSPDLDGLYREAVDERQELKKKRAMIQKMEKMLEMAETMTLPAFTLNLSLYDDDPAMRAGTSAMQPAFDVSIRADTGAGSPVNPWFGKDDAYVAEARMTLAALRSELKQAESDTRAAIRKAWFELDRASRETSLFDKHIVSETRAILDVSTRGYESGKASFADIISSHMDWLNAALTLRRKTSDMGIAWAELSRIAGTDLAIWLPAGRNNGTSEKKTR